MAWLQEVVLTDEELEFQRKRGAIQKAVTLIQTHERGRQSRVYFFDLCRLHMMRIQASKPGYKPPPPLPKEIIDKSATLIQKTWKGYTTREYLKKKENERRLLIGNLLVILSSSMLNIFSC